MSRDIATTILRTVSACAASPYVDLVELRHAVDEHRDLVAEVLAQLLERVVGVLDGVVEQRRGERRRGHAELGEDAGDGDRVRDVRVAAAPLLPGVGLGRHLEGALEEREIGLRVHVPDGAQQRLEQRRGGGAAAGPEPGDAGEHAARRRQALARRHLPVPRGDGRGPRRASGAPRRGCRARSGVRRARVGRRGVGGLLGRRQRRDRTGGVHGVDIGGQVGDGGQRGPDGPASDRGAVPGVVGCGSGRRAAAHRVLRRDPLLRHRRLQQLRAVSRRLSFVHCTRATGPGKGPVTAVRDGQMVTSARTGISGSRARP